MNNLRKIFLIGGALVLLNGCTAGFKEEASCTLIDGVRSCDGIMDISNMVRDGYISADDEGNVHRGYNSDKKKADIAINSLAINGSNPLSDRRAPRRIQEEILYIEIAPYLDQEHNYHGAKEVSTVLTKSMWDLPSVEPTVKP